MEKLRTIKSLVGNMKLIYNNVNKIT